MITVWRTTLGVKQNNQKRCVHFTAQCTVNARFGEHSSTLRLVLKISLHALQHQLEPQNKTKQKNGCGAFVARRHVSSIENKPARHLLRQRQRGARPPSFTRKIASVSKTSGTATPSSSLV